MVRYIVRKVLTGVVVFVSVTALTFWLFYVRGGLSIARSFLPENTTPARVAAEARSLGLLRPLPVQYLDWLGQVFTGSLGNSYQDSEPVIEVLSSRIPVTLSLVIVSLILLILLAVPLGVSAALRGGAVDRGLQILSVVVQAIPGYWLALILVIVFGLTLRLVPATGYIPISESFAGWLSSIILPSLAIALGAVAFVAAQIRGSMLDAMRQEYVRTLRSRGIPWRSIVLKHALRNAAPATLTILSLQVIGLLGGAIIVERIYALQGLGTVSISSGQAGDVPVVLGTVAFMVIVVVVVNLATDILNGFLNPKARV
jgi:peptide/nickel transport system permease protein